MTKKGAAGVSRVSSGGEGLGVGNDARARDLGLRVTSQALDALVGLVAARVAALVITEIESVVSPAMSEPWRLVDVEEVAAMLGRSTRWVHQSVKERGLPFVRLDGGALAFDPDDVRAWALARRVPALESDPLADRWHGGRDAALGAGSGNGDRTVMQRVRGARGGP